MHTAGENSTERLQRYLASCGLGSRRSCERLIEAGRVQVNGDIARLGDRVDPMCDSVLLDGAPVTPEPLVYVLLNKPAGTVTTAKDTHGRPTVTDLVASAGARVVPVGRLDLDVSGALLLTNDGDLAHRLSHPRFEVGKTYRALVRGEVDDEAIRRLESGVELDDGPTAPAEVRCLSRGDRSTLELRVHEGRNHLIKRMCENVGHPVIRLERIAFGPLTCDGLAPGEWRILTAEELQVLRAIGKSGS